MRDFVEARLDVTFQHPLVGVLGEVVRLGDRVMRPALRTEPVGTRVEVRLEDPAPGPASKTPGPPGPARWGYQAGGSASYRSRRAWGSSVPARAAAGSYGPSTPTVAGRGTPRPRARPPRSRRSARP